MKQPLQPRRPQGPPAGPQIRRPMDPVQAPKPVLVSKPAPVPTIPVVLGSKKSAASDIDQRRDERKRARRSLLSMRLLFAAGGLSAAALIVWILFFSPVLALNASSVAITADSPQVDVAAVTAIVSGRAGTPLLRLNTTVLRDDLLKNPLIADATIVRKWPDGIEVAITARVPRLAVAVGGGYDFVAADGVVTASGSAVPDGLLQVENIGGESLSNQQATQILVVWDSLDQELRDQVDLLSLDGGIITLHLTGGAQVKWGDSSDAALKAQVLSLLIEQRPSAIYDVTDPVRPSVR